jgi:hypothetical protein
MGYGEKVFAFRGRALNGCGVRGYDWGPKVLYDGVAVSLRAELQFCRSGTPRLTIWRRLQGESTWWRGLRDGANFQGTRPGREGARRQPDERYLCTPWGDEFQGFFLGHFEFSFLRGRGGTTNEWRNRSHAWVEH